MMDQAEQEKLDAAFLKAANQGRLASAQAALAAGANINATDWLGDNALELATRRHHPEMAVFLLAAGINKDHQNNAGQAALHMAFIYESKKIAAALLQHRANPDLRDEDGATPLFFAPAAFYLDLLHAAHADMSTSDDNGWTPLMCFAEDGKPALCQTMIEAGANPDIANPQGETALMLAAKCGQMDVVKLLAEAGADLDITDNEGSTAADTAQDWGHKQVAAYLIKFAQDKKARAVQRELEKEIATFNNGSLARPMTAPQKLQPIKTLSLKAGP